MKDSNSNNFLILLLAAFAIYVPFSSTPSSPDQQPSAQPQLPALVQMVPLPTPTPNPTPGLERVSGEAAKLLCDFFGAKPDSDQDAQGQSSDQKQARPTGPPDFEPKNLRGDYCRAKSFLDLNRGGQPASGKYKFEYLIATVPDPKDSRLYHLFDRYQDAIQRAIGEADYTFDRYWLPWDRSRTAAPVASPTDPRAPQMAIATRHLYEPGVILFRDKGGGNRLLLLFMVGETPTGGIHKVAFRNALWQIEKLEGWMESKTKKATDKSLRIISPCFSGSDASLATLLKAWIQEYKTQGVTPPEVKIVSGTAIAINKKRLEGIPGGKVCFHAAVVEREPAISKFYEYLKGRDSLSNRGEDGPQVAFLSEAGTTSGQRTRKPEQNEDQLPKKMEAKQNEDQLPILNLTFPLHISQLRIEAAKISLPRDEVSKALLAKAPDLALPMREAGSPTAKDIVPLFSQVETVTMDLALDEALSAIHRGRIRYVGVAATDVQDLIYLVREIRKHCPNAMIFIHNNDLLYLHSESYFDFQGALIISPYPLFGLNQLWTYPFEGDRRRLQFSTQGAQGLYNATLALLDKEDKMLEYGFPLKEYGKDDNRYPALWLGIVGRNGIWPVKTFDTGSFKITEQSLESLKSGRVPPDVLGKLQGIIDQEFNGEKRFIDKLNEVIGDSQTNKFKKLFLQHARDPYTLTVEHKADKQKKYHLGLSGNYQWPTGFFILLLIGFICLVLSWFSPGWLGQIFGDEEFYRYRLDHRINMMSCRVSLAAITLFISSVAMLPAWVSWEMTKEEAFSYKVLAPGAIFVLALATFIWSVVSIIWWMFSGRLHFRWYTVGLVSSVGAAIIMFFGWGLIKFFGAEPLIAGTVLVLVLAAYIWLVMIVISGRRHFRKYICALLSPVGAAMIAFFGWGLIKIFWAKPPEEQIFFFLRATELASGVSILLPGLLIGLAAFLSFFTALWRLNLAARMPCLPDPRERPGEAPQFLRFGHKGESSFNGLKPLEDNVKEMIVRPIHDDRWVCLIVIVSLLVYWLPFGMHFIPSVEGREFDWFFKLGFYIVPLSLFLALLRFFRLWKAIEKLLQQLSSHPLIWSFAAGQSEKERLASLPRVDLMTSTPDFVAALSASAWQARSFYESLKSSELSPEQAKTAELIKPLVKKAEIKLSRARHSDATGKWRRALIRRHGLQAALAALSEHSAGLLEDSWRKGLWRKDGDKGADADLRRKGSGEEADADWRRKDDGKEADADWRREGKHFLITHIMVFLHHVFAHLRSLVALVTIGLLLMLITAFSYPFQPREPLRWFSWVGILTSVVVTIYVFVKISRNRTLSLLAGTTPDKLSVTSDFVIRVIFHGMIPLIAMLGVQFPDAVRRISSWLSGVFEGKGN